LLTEWTYAERSGVPSFAPPLGQESYQDVMGNVACAGQSRRFLVGDSRIGSVRVMGDVLSQVELLLRRCGTRGRAVGPLWLGLHALLLLLGNSPSRAREGASAGHAHRENTLRICRWKRREGVNKLGVTVEGTNDLESDDDRAALGSRESSRCSP